MSVWIELRCSGELPADCYSAQNDGPMSISRDNASDVTYRLAELKQEGKRKGWRFRRAEGWFCPYCANLPRE